MAFGGKVSDFKETWKSLISYVSYSAMARLLPGTERAVSMSTHLRSLLPAFLGVGPLFSFICRTPGWLFPMCAHEEL